MKTDVSPIRIVIADDHEIFRNGLKLLLKNQKEIQLVGEAENGKQLVTLVNEQEPDVVITDIQMPECNGIAACRLIKKSHPFIQIIALTTFNDDHFIVDMLEAGASGYLLKNTNKQELQEAIKTVYEGNVYYSSATSKKLAKLVAESKVNLNRKSLVIKFSPREIKIMELVCQQLTNKEIASQLGVSVRTVESHREHIQEKIGAKNTAGVVVYAMKHHFFDI